MNKIRCKICGITTPDAARAAADAGVDAVGLVFYEKSPRHIDRESARAVIRALPAFVSVVALTVNASAELIFSLLDDLDIDILQFHGDEPEDFCRRFNRPYIKAVRVAQAADIRTALQSHTHARALLFDTYQAHVYGGTGQSFDWTLLRDIPPERPWILAGGLTPDNVARAVAVSGAPAVDVSGGVEQSPGVKDEQKIRALMQALRKLEA